MRIVTDETGTGWIVLADWHGAQRIVHRGDLYSCARFANAA